MLYTDRRFAAPRKRLLYGGKNCIIVSLNFIVEIITEWEPNIEVNNFLNY